MTMKKAGILFLTMILVFIQLNSAVYANEETIENISEDTETFYGNIIYELEKLVEKYEIAKDTNKRLRLELLNLYNRISNKPAKKVPVLMYHHLLEQEDINTYNWNGNSSVLSVESFEKQMDYLYENGYYTATLDELQKYIEGEIMLPEKTVVITFDDGYYSNIIYAYPIMKKYNFRGTIFLVGNTHSQPQKEFHPEGLQHISVSQRHRYRDVFDYGSHSYNLHRKDKNGRPILISSDEKTIKEDLQKNMALVNTKYFAYPYGSYSNKAIRYLKETGHEMAFTTQRGYVSPSMDKFKLPRFSISPKISMEGFINIVKPN